MPEFDGIISFLGSRSFGSVWFWLVLIGMWSATGRNVLGVPTEILGRARRAQAAGDLDSRAVVTLLDWLSLVLPRWQTGPREGAVFLAVTSFLLTSLAVMGFGYGLEMAQALTLLLVPFAMLFWLRVLLARRLVPLLAAGQEGDRPVAGVAADCIRLMSTHRLLVTGLSIVAVAATAMWGMLWTLIHPNGL